MKLTQVIERICRLAAAIAAHGAAELRKRGHDPRFIPLSVLADLPKAAELQELRTFLHSQSPATTHMLVVLWRLGRGDFSADCDLLDEYVEVSDSFAKPGAAADYLLGKILPPCLREALKELAHAGIDADGLLI